VTAAPPIDLPRARANSWPSRDPRLRFGPGTSGVIVIFAAIPGTAELRRIGGRGYWKGA
jgi:hypothetical protein